MDSLRSIRTNRALAALVLGVLTLALYLPTLRSSFLTFDDQQYVTENFNVNQGLSGKAVVWAFGFHASNWHPLTWLSHMLDCQLYGARAWGHHLTNALLHALTTVILFLAFDRLTGRLARSACVAGLFAWHPAHVESVAWIAERKDILCALFWALTLLLYARYVTRPNSRSYLWIVLSYAACLMSKPMGVTLPFVLLLLDFWPLKRIGGKSFGKLIVEKIPLLLMAAGACWLTVKAQTKAIVSTGQLPFSQRLSHSAISYAHYLLITFWSTKLAVFYPYDPHENMSVAIACGVLLALITVITLIYWRSLPYLAVGWFWFLGTLVPVIGLMQVGDQAWADRYTYLPLVGIFIALVWLAAEKVKSRELLQFAGGMIAIALLIVTSVQISYWKDTRTLFEHANEVTHDNYMALTMVGSQFAALNDLDFAIDHYQRALKIFPTYPKAHFYLANARERQGRLEEAVAEYRQAIQYHPERSEAHVFLAMLLKKLNRDDEAIAEYQEALKADPDSAVAENNLANILNSQGKLTEAIVHYQKALAINPDLYLAHNNLGILLVREGDLTNGLVHIRTSLRENPTNAETMINLGMALNQAGEWNEAETWFAKALPGDAATPQLNYQYGLALEHVGKTKEAMSRFASALLVQSDYADALSELAWVASTSTNAELRNAEEAAPMAQQAVQLTGGKDARKIQVLAAAYAESGDLEKAKSTIAVAIQNATETHNTNLLPVLANMQRQFEAGKPWRQ